MGIRGPNHEKHTLVVRMTMGADKGETSITAAVHHMTPPRPILSLGILEQPTGEEKRTEIVVETSADEAREMRTSRDIFQIGGWRKASDGKVATTFDLPENQIVQYTTGKVWAKTSVRARNGLVLFATEAQWEELSVMLAKCHHTEGVIRESPRWVLIETRNEKINARILDLLRHWRRTGLVTTDIGYRVWTSADNRIEIKTGTIEIDEKITLHVYDASPSFKHPCCKAFLKALGVEATDSEI